MIEIGARAIGVIRGRMVSGVEAENHWG
jgi:hypothetical protein